MARFIDESIYRDTFPAIRIAILFFTIAIVFLFLFKKNWLKKNNCFFLPHNGFDLGRKDNIYIRFLQSNSSNTVIL